MAHGALLRKNGFSLDQLKAIYRDFHNAGLPQSEVDMMDFAYRMSQEPHAVTQADIQKLRNNGLIDEQILDIVTAAAVRNFFSRTLDALGVEPNASSRDSDPELFDFVTNSEYKQ